LVASLILKKQDRGEADELVVFLSRELGWLRGVAKNAKKSRVRFGGHLEPFSLVDLTLRQRKRDDLVWIEEAQVIHGHLGIRSSIAKVARAAYFLELASVLLPEDSPDPVLFDFLHDFLESLESANPTALSFLLEEIRLLGLLGYAPRFDACPVCGKTLERGIEGVFLPALGGVCHRACVPAGDLEKLAVSPGTLAVVRRGLELSSEAARRLRLNKHGQEELRRILSAFARYTRGGEISSLIFLETMDL
jgi:DNA repair protein RecO (recombination protein O)